jgi:hypothetical protein
MEIKKRILSSVDYHKKIVLSAMPKLYKHENKFSVYRALIELRNEGWIKINNSYTENGDVINMKCVLRRRKTMYEQGEIFKP